MLTVELEPGVWLADGEGDPPRTLTKENARQFVTRFTAMKALDRALSYRMFRQWRIHDENGVIEARAQ